ncbi:unknown [Firmicutes bacterium CAG:536]|nr:unknown [Firmicutes bacterium CAG:536]
MARKDRTGNRKTRDQRLMRRIQKWDIIWS